MALSDILVSASELILEGHSKSDAVDFLIDALHDMLEHHPSTLDTSLRKAVLDGMDPDLLVIAITTLWYHRDELPSLVLLYERAGVELLRHGYQDQLDALHFFRGMLFEI